MQLTVHPPDTVPATTESSDRIPEMKRIMSSSEGYDTMTDATSEAMSEVSFNTSDSYYLQSPTNRCEYCSVIE